VGKQKSESGTIIRKATPLERAIAEQKDRRRKHDAKKERDGFKRTTVWVREDRLSEVKEFIQRVNEAEPR